MCLILSLKSLYRTNDLWTLSGIPVDSAQSAQFTSNPANNLNHTANATLNMDKRLKDATIITNNATIPVIMPIQEPNQTSTATIEHNIETNTSSTGDIHSNMPLNLNRRKIPISIVVQLSGEMGNNLHKIAFGRALQNLVKERYQMDTKLVFRHQESKIKRLKWISAKNDIQKCFPKLRHFDFELGNSDEFEKRRSQQANWLGGEAAQLLQLENGISASQTDKGLEYLQRLVANQTDRTIMEPPNANISLPFIYSLNFVDYSWIDRYYDDFRELLTFDELACCNLVPGADESVFVSEVKSTDTILLQMHVPVSNGSHFMSHLHLNLYQHFRNYITEMPKQWKRKGFIELSPNRTANELFQHLQPGEKVAIVSRFQSPHTLAYADALKERGLEIRSISNSTGVEDFCFLMKTKRELAGPSQSTYCFWSAFLGNATTNWLYSISSNRKHLQYNWIHPEIRSRMRFPIF